MMKIESSLLLAFLSSLLLACCCCVSFIQAVPPTFTDFHPQRDSVEYGLVVTTLVANKSNNATTKNKFSVLTMAEIKLFNLQKDVKATCRFNNSLNQIGWNYLHVVGNPTLVQNPETRSEAYYYAGFLEGVLTVTHILDLHRETILKNRRRFFPSSSLTSQKAAVWVQNQIAWNKAMIANSTSKNDANFPFWQQVKNQFSQMEGLADGASHETGFLYNFTLFDIYSINLDAEWTAIEKHVAGSGGNSEQQQEQEPSHCSALFRITDSNELFASHTTWSPYQIMVRYYKTYEFQTKIVFSSYPAFIASADDWLTTSNQLTSLETTNGIYNNSLYQYVIPQTVSEFNRNMIANYLSQDCFEWAKYFSSFNSGTYSNSWFCMNSKIDFSRAGANVSGLLVLAEQIPGLVGVEDVSNILLKQRYFASYNIPFQKSIHAISGFSKMEQEFGTFFNYYKTNRAQIFAKYAPQVQDLRSFQNLMRWNDFENSPLSLIPNCSGCPNDRCSPKYSPMLAIASRGDLGVAVSSHQSKSGNASASYCLGPLAGYLQKQQFGALDCKIASYGNRTSMTTTAISGPTNVQQPTFEFSDKDWIPVEPKKWNFPWVTFYQD